MKATSHIPLLDKWKNKQQSAVGATVLRDLRGSQSEPLPALLFLRSSRAPTRGCRNSPGASSTSSSRRSLLLSTSSCFCRRHNAEPSLAHDRMRSLVDVTPTCPQRDAPTAPWGTTVRERCVFRTSQRLPLPTGRRRLGQATKRPKSASASSRRCTLPTACRSRGTGRAAHGLSPSLAATHASATRAAVKPKDYRHMLV